MRIRLLPLDIPALLALLPSKEKALIAACKKGDLAGIEKALLRGASANISTTGGFTPLMLAAMNGHTEAVRLLLRSGASPNFRQSDGSSPIHDAIFAGDLEMMKLLMKAGADPNRPDGGGYAPVILAAARPETECLELLLEREIDVNAKTQHGRTAVFEACYWGRIQNLRLLLEAGADPNVRHTEDGLYPLLVYVGHVRAWNEDKELRLPEGYLGTLDLLLEKGTDVKVLDRDRENVIGAAVRLGHGLEVVKRLLEAGADPKHKDKEGESAETHAARHPDPNVAALFSEPT